VPLLNPKIEYDVALVVVHANNEWFLKPPCPLRS